MEFIVLRLITVSKSIVSKKISPEYSVLSNLLLNKIVVTGYNNDPVIRRKTSLQNVLRFYRHNVNYRVNPIGRVRQQNSGC